MTLNIPEAEERARLQSGEVMIREFVKQIRLTLIAMEITQEEADYLIEVIRSRVRLPKPWMKPYHNKP